MWLFLLSHSFTFFRYHFLIMVIWLYGYMVIWLYGYMFCTFLFNFVNCLFLFLCLCIFIVIFIYSYCFFMFCSGYFVSLCCFCVLFVCKRTLYCCHLLSNQFQLTNISYHIVSYFIYQLHDLFLIKVSGLSCH